MPDYPNRLPPFAVKFSFISERPLEECIDRLVDASNIPFPWPRGYRPFRWRFTYSPINADLYEFQAVSIMITGGGSKGGNATDIAARGRLQRIENEQTHVIGCADATEIFYEFMIFVEIVKFIIFVWLFNNGTRNGWLVVAFLEAVTTFLFTCLGLVGVRLMSKRLSRIVEHLVATES